MININNKKEDTTIPKDDEYSIYSSLNSNQIENAIKNLSNPRFLGSIHIKKEQTHNNSPVNRLLENEHQLRLNKSIRSAMFNPITKLLIGIALLFNIIWLSLYFLL